jgi:hypothetical protein
MSGADNAVISLALLVVTCLPVWVAFKVVPLAYDRVARQRSLWRSAPPARLER